MYSLKYGQRGTYIQYTYINELNIKITDIYIYITFYNTNIIYIYIYTAKTQHPTIVDHFCPARRFYGLGSGESPESDVDPNEANSQPHPPAAYQ